MVDAAADSDEIRVWQGTYTGTGYAVIDTKGKAVWIRGMGDPWDPAPVIDGEMQRRAIHCASGETA